MEKTVELRMHVLTGNEGGRLLSVLMARMLTELNAQRLMRPAPRSQGERAIQEVTLEEELAFEVVDWNGEAIPHRGPSDGVGQQLVRCPDSLGESNAEFLAGVSASSPPAKSSVLKGSDAGGSTQRTSTFLFLSSSARGEYTAFSWPSDTYASD
ncbi:unnamed protein product [Prorocentrum cordatum]|uniref:Uncharacterized protein n=1 Tax=Prorocentrum cordatum TaxID=2364126 RepID=A0ABN9VS25_9DINO|nr:unnamed protein product [Polarella glacialis]